MGTSNTNGQVERPAGACLLCRPPIEGRPWRLADQGYVTCSSCLDRLRELITDIVTRCGRLDPAPQHDGGDPGSRGAPGFGSRSPARDHVISMLDRRSSESAYVWVAADGRVHQESEHPTLSVFGVFDTIAWEIADARGIDGPPDGSGVDALSRWVDRHLDWLTRQTMVVEVAERLRRLRGQLMPVTGDPRIKVGSCPNTIDEGEHTRTCGGQLFATANMSPDDVIRCVSCRREWYRKRGDWEKLGDLLDHKGEPAQEEPAA